jgi:Tfp pilus assembly major pilin PilA
MKRTQRGVTMIGWIVLLIPIAIVGYSAIRLIPIYLNYMKIARSMEQTAQELRGSDTQQGIRTSLEKRLDIEQVEFPDVKDFTIRREGQSWVVEIEYEDGAPLMSNVSLAAKFKKAVRIGDKPE